MSHQSPKSQRSKAPGENPASDNNPTQTIGGETSRQVSGTQGPRVPGGLKHAGGAHQGSADTDNSPMASGGSAPPHQGGGPGFAKGKGDGERKGGSVHQT